MPAIKPSQRGFTLVEMIIGIVIFGIALALVTSLVFPQARRSVDPIMQVRATELANTLLQEISSKSFDENGIGTIRCNDDLNLDGDLDDGGESQCTPAASFGPEGETRNSAASNFDDVDDYHGLSQGAGQAEPELRNSLGETLQVNGRNLYAGFSYSVSVIYDGDLDGIADNNQASKLITIMVKMPNSETVAFSTYRSNY